MLWKLAHRFFEYPCSTDWHRELTELKFVNGNYCDEARRDAWLMGSQA